MNSNLAYQLDEPWREPSRVQLIDGAIVAMSPRPSVNHTRASGNIYRILSRYLDGHTCEAFPDGVDLYLTQRDRFVPDGMVVCDPSKIRPNGVYGAPDLVIEVLSPATARYDRKHKMDVYEQHGVREYWIVSPGEVSVEQYVLRDGKLEFQDLYTLYHAYDLEGMTESERAALVTTFHCGIFPDLEIDLHDVFRRVLTD